MTPMADFTDPSISKTPSKPHLEIPRASNGIQRKKEFKKGLAFLCGPWTLAQFLEARRGFSAADETKARSTSQAPPSKHEPQHDYTPSHPLKSHLTA